MTRQQFKRLADVFWKSATAAQLESTWSGYACALDDLPPHTIDRAIDRALRECKNTPRPAELREWATMWIPRTTVRKLDTDGPCQHCDGTVEQTVDPDTGALGRMYIAHRDRCPMPTLSKPDHLAWLHRARPVALLPENVA